MIAAGQIAAVGALGVLSGLFGGLFGIGGGVLAIPLLGLLFGLHQQMAQGTVLIMVALLSYARAGEVDWGLGIPLAIGGIAAIPAGVAVAYRLPERRLRLGFCGLLLVTAALLALHG